MLVKVKKLFISFGSIENVDKFSFEFGTSNLFVSVRVGLGSLRLKIQKNE
jgi:hypothetical protein